VINLKDFLSLRQIISIFFREFTEGRLNRGEFLFAVLGWVGVLVIIFLPYFVTLYIECPAFFLGRPDEFLNFKGCDYNYAMAPSFRWHLFGILAAVFWFFTLVNIIVKRSRDTGNVLIVISLIVISISVLMYFGLWISLVVMLTVFLVFLLPTDLFY